MNNVIPIVFCFDKRIILGASVAIKSLIDCAKETTCYDIRIFHSDLDINLQTNLTSLVENTRHNIAFHYINPQIFKGVPKSRGSWNEVVYYKFLIPQILSQYDKVIYSDVDVLFKDDLNELYSNNVSDYEFGAVKAERNTPNVIGHNYFEENKNEYIYWSGLMLFNCNRFREESTFDKLMGNAKVFNKRLIYYDLDLVNITCDRILPVSLKYCLLQGFIRNNDYKKVKEYEFLKDIYSDEEITKAIKNPAIIHYAGKPGKPWRFKNPYKDYKEYMDKLPKDLKKFTFRDMRKRLLSRI